jgi:hypothetical protein
MDRPGKAEDVHANVVFRREVDGSLYALAGSLHCNLLGIQMNPVLGGFGDYEVAKFGVRSRINQADSHACERRKVLEVAPQLDVRQIDGTNLPAGERRGPEQEQSDDDNDVFHGALMAPKEARTYF